MVMALLRRLVTEKVALDLVLTGRVFSAEEARSAGLVSRVVADSELERDTLSLATGLAGASATALGITKQLFYELDSRNLADGIALGARVNAVARSTPDFRQAIAAFLKQ
jgi:enoyl-CoA hydratase/carnithine racemase